jgi:hypothetical protein
MQAYRNDPAVKAMVLERPSFVGANTLPPVKRPVDSHAQVVVPGTPPLIWPATPPSDGDLDYEAELGIPLLVALIAEAIGFHVKPPPGSLPWAEAFFARITPGQDLSDVAWRWLDAMLHAVSTHDVGPVPWDALAQLLLALITAQPVRP